MASERKWSKGIRAETFDDGAFVIYDGDGAVLCQRSSWPHRIEESLANGVLFGASEALYNALEAVHAELVRQDIKFGPLIDDAAAALSRARGA